MNSLTLAAPRLWKRNRMPVCFVRPLFCLALFFLVFSRVTSAAPPAWAAIFNDGAVLQCGMPANVWGTAEPGANLTIHLDGEKLAEATAQGDGRWIVKLPAQEAGGPHTLEAKVGAESAALKDVVFGEVWIASGQSNMVWPLDQTEGGKESLLLTIPEIRFVVVPSQTGLPPQPMTAEQLKWRSFAPGPNESIGAVAFYFAEYLQKQVGGTVGIIQSAVGGTPAQAWTPLWALDEKQELKYLGDYIREAMASGKQRADWQKEIRDFGQFRKAHLAWTKTKEGPAPTPVPEPGPTNPWYKKSPTVLFENMIQPLIPYTARGVIWYQGEANAPNPGEYRILFPTMIEAWRKAWQSPDLPFLFVQLASYASPNPKWDWVGVRSAQAFTRDTVPHTGMAVTIDRGDRDDTHPKFKQPVGERLARLALAQIYGRNIPARGPLMKQAARSAGQVTVTFDHAGPGLSTSDGASEVPGFEVAGADGKFHPAEARITGFSTVELSSTSVPEPVSIRYAWADWIEPPVTLRNADGLPAEPAQVTVP
jgi:sialate O-acetylesterase